MRILFVTRARGVDYLSDCVFHGLVKQGHDVVDSKYMWYNSPITAQQRMRLYGKGFTIPGLLPDRSNINRSNLQERIRAQEFDIIVYGSIWRCKDYLDTVIKNYPKERIIFLDGEDGIQYNGKYLIKELLDKGIYFKRQLRDASALPISFSIPEQKLLIQHSPKGRLQAIIVPGDKSTYIYTRQEDYYQGYATSYFGLTKKKAGWDCMRHYQIIGSRCLPYFMDFQACPRFTMVNWPTELQLEANNMYQTKHLQRYDKVLQAFFSYCKQNLITVKSAQYVLSKVF